jgi:hypothetical protein
MHAIGTVDVVGQHVDDPLVLALAHDSMTEMQVTPWYRNTIEISRKLIGRYHACIEGRPEPRTTDPAARISDAHAVAMMYDADLFGGVLEIVSVQALPQEVMARPGVVDRIMEVASAHEAVIPPGPSRAELLRMLASESTEAEYVAA